MNDDHSLTRIITTIFLVLFIVICIGINICAFHTGGYVGLACSCIVTLPVSIGVTLKAAKTYAGVDKVNLKQIKDEAVHSEKITNSRDSVANTVTIKDCRFCTHCGAVVDEVAEVCPECGSKL